MSKTRINWGFAGFIGAAACVCGGGLAAITLLLQSEMATSEALKPTTAAVDGASYTLVNSDIVEVKKDELTHIFNFGFDHVMVIGKVGETEINNAFTFDQFGQTGIIQDITARGCAIAAQSATGITDTTIERAVTARENARLFLKKHCPQPATPHG